MAGMTGVPGEYRLYQDLAAWWPLISPVGEYAAEAAYLAAVFHAGPGGGGSTDPDGRQGSFREWAWDPDPVDEWIQAEYEFVLRAADGTVQVVHEAHRLGAFHRDTWLRLLAAAGFEPEAGSGV